MRSPGFHGGRGGRESNGWRQQPRTPEEQKLVKSAGGFLQLRWPLVPSAANAAGFTCRISCYEPRRLHGCCWKPLLSFLALSHLGLSQLRQSGWGKVKAGSLRSALKGWGSSLLTLFPFSWQGKHFLAGKLPLSTEQSLLGRWEDGGKGGCLSSVILEGLVLLCP